MTRTEILDQLAPIFRDVFHDDSLMLNERMSADDMERWDSFHHINLIVAIEREFGFKFHSADIEGLTDVGHLATVIERMIAQSRRRVDRRDDYLEDTRQGSFPEGVNSGNVRPSRKRD